MNDDRMPPKGNGGETHQPAGDGHATMTTQVGMPISDGQNTLKIGQRGPHLLEDQVFREKIFHFDHERIPERVVHARGYGAHGTFELNEDLSDLTRARVLTEVGEKTEVFVRFSTVAGNKGSADLARDVRGFAVKFYTKEGNWDLVGNNIPVFFIQDAMKFPDLIHAAKQEPDRAFPQAQTAHDNFWDFISLMPEAMHMALWIMSDRTIPRSFRFMEGFGVHTFRLVNSEGKSSFVKFHWKPKQGVQSVLWDEAVKINGADPDFHRRDLWDAIGKGDYPKWDLGVQVFDDAFADSFDFDVLDATKLIPEEQVPVRIVGTMTLDRMPENFFVETEQVAFQTGNIVPGIDHSNDPLLQGRNFSYLDTQLKRLGSPNFNHIPVNAPKCPFAHLQQDGHMAMHNPKGRANYEPNSHGEGPREDPERGFRSYEAEEAGPKQRIRSETFADHYSQARQFYLSQTDIEKGHIADAFIFELSKVERLAIRQRMVGHLMVVDEGLAQMVAEGLGLPEMPAPAEPARKVVETEVSPALSILANPPESFAGRKLGVLLTDGIDGGAFDALRKAAEAEGAQVTVVAEKVGGVTTARGKAIEADEKLAGAPSVLFDAVAILASEDGAAKLAGMHGARTFLADAFAHKKFIALSAEAKSAFWSAAVPDEPDEGVFVLDGAPEDFIGACKDLRFWGRAA